MNLCVRSSKMLATWILAKLHLTHHDHIIFYYKQQLAQPLAQLLTMTLVLLWRTRGREEGQWVLVSTAKSVLSCPPFYFLCQHPLWSICLYYDVCTENTKQDFCDIAQSCMGTFHHPGVKSLVPCLVCSNKKTFNFATI